MSPQFWAVKRNKIKDMGNGVCTRRKIEENLDLFSRKTGRGPGWGGVSYEKK
jgi:hypothetical protein